MQLKAQLMNENDIRRALIRVSHEIIEKHKGVNDVYLVGIRRRGVPLALEIQRNIEQFEGVLLPLGVLDITYYRDDLEQISEAPILNSSDFPESVEGKKIILVDDVIFTGRTVRAAIEALFDLGRPASIELATLIDRGHRELPLRPDYVGKNVPTALSERVSVSLEPIDGVTQVELYAK